MSEFGLIEFESAVLWVTRSSEEKVAKIFVKIAKKYCSNLGTLAKIYLFIYIFIYLGANQKEHGKDRCYKGKGQDQAIVDGYMFYLLLWQGISKKVIFFLLICPFVFLDSGLPPCLSGSAWRIVFICWFEDGGCSL